MLVLLKFRNGVLIVYLLMLSLRIILTWFSGPPLGRAWELLCGATEPYLSQFYRIRFLRRDIFDFTPIAAILVLVVLIDLVSSIINYGRITLGFFLGSVLSAVWSGASFILLLFFFVGLIRVIGILFRTESIAALWKVIDVLIQPIVLFVKKYITLGNRAGYTQYLFLTLVLLFVTWFLGNVITRTLIRLLSDFPI